jgi:hypothetical protein
MLPGAPLHRLVWGVQMRQRTLRVPQGLDAAMRWMARGAVMEKYQA